MNLSHDFFSYFSSNNTLKISFNQLCFNYFLFDINLNSNFNKIQIKSY